MSHQPVELPPGRLAQLNPSAGSKLHLGGIWGHVESGQTWLANDGKRLVVSADSMSVIYVLCSAKNPSLDGKTFIQNAQGFRGEVTTYPLTEAGRRAAPMARLAEYEMQILMGICGATSGVGFAAVLGTGILEFLVSNKDKFGKWNKALAVIVACRAILKKHAPTLYDKLIEATLVAAGAGFAESLRNIPATAANDPKIIGRAVGTIIGKLGKKAMTARLGALGVIWILLSSLATKALGAVPGALKISLQEREKTAEAIISELKKAGVTITAADARKIVEEVTAHPKQLVDSLQQLRQAFEGIRPD